MDSQLNENDESQMTSQGRESEKIVYANRKSSLNAIEFSRAVSQVIAQKDREVNSTLSILEIDSTKDFAIIYKYHTFRSLLQEISEEIYSHTADSNNLQVIVITIDYFFPDLQSVVPNKI
jgi:hypothetical protein